VTQPAEWAHHNPVRILFGPGRLSELGRVVAGRVLLVATTGTTQRGLTRRVVDQLHEPPLIHDSVRSNPTLADVGAAIDRWRGSRVDWVVAIGGGSALDVGKILSLALADPRVEIDRLLREDHPWHDLQPKPMVAIPTTAGTGSEVTPFATIWDTDPPRKRSVGTERLHPTVALVDPELTSSLPWRDTLSTGLDAFSQCFEAICNRRATPITTAIAERGIQLVPDGLRELMTDPASRGARHAMSEAALLSGLAISETRTGLAHSISYPITAHLGVPHGLACAIALPAVVGFNVETDDGRLGRVATLMSLSTARDLVPDILSLYRDLGVAQEVRRYVADATALEPYVPEMLTTARADNNIRSVTGADIPSLLKATDKWLRDAHEARG
jgi:phosphonate metabolism-associated iron-containing alcohol dehydrogenase